MPYMNLTIENSAFATQIQAAYNVAINATNLQSFISELQIQLPSFTVGRGGDHIFISNGENRAAIITKLFN